MYVTFSYKVLWLTRFLGRRSLRCLGTVRCIHLFELYRWRGIDTYLTQYHSWIKGEPVHNSISEVGRFNRKGLLTTTNPCSLAVDSVQQCVMSVIPVRLDDIQCSNPIGLSKKISFHECSWRHLSATFTTPAQSPSPSPSENALENATYTAYVAQVPEGYDQEDAFQDDIWNWLWGDRLVWQRVMVIVILLVVPGTLCCLCLCLASIGLRRFGGRETDVEQEVLEVWEEQF